MHARTGSPTGPPASGDPPLPRAGRRVPGPGSRTRMTGTMDHMASLDTSIEAADEGPVPEHEPQLRYLNRELSWLDFNGRVLALAEDPSVPLLERAKFLAIFS
ncbi:MAG: RNA degradosome polyphosphate kinase, partial [Thermoleophilaceae bacterium]